MDDELDSLRDAQPLRDLLAHYAALAAPDKQAWHPRRDAGDGENPRSLSRLHGELIANGWIDQNTGVLAPGSYRATRAGLKALERVAAGTLSPA